jgi:hypothetical protein
MCIIILPLCSVRVSVTYRNSICSGKSYEWQSSALQALQMIIEITLLPLVIAAIRLSHHRSAASNGVNGVVLLSSADISLAMRMCWIYRVPALLRSSTQRIDISDINIGKVLTDADRHQWKPENKGDGEEDENHSTRHRHFNRHRKPNKKLKKPASATDSTEAKVVDTTTDGAPKPIQGHPIYHIYRPFFDQASKSASQSYHRHEITSHNITAREGQVITYGTIVHTPLPIVYHILSHVGVV